MLQVLLLRRPLHPRNLRLSNMLRLLFPYLLLLGGPLHPRNLRLANMLRLVPEVVPPRPFPSFFLSPVESRSVRRIDFFFHKNMID
jgi:hypothetical protein